MKRHSGYQSPPPVEHIDLPEGNTKRRWIIVIALLVIAITAFGIGMHSMLNRQRGWTEIAALSGAPGCAPEFQLQYELPEKDGRTVYRTISALYTTACTRAAQVYDAAASYEGVGNVCTINAHPNETVTVEPELYAALELIQQAKNRVPYLAPLYETYTSLFFCAEDIETADFDPLRNPELAASFTALAAFANDPEQTDLELLGNNRVCLHVSETYLRYGAENGVGVWFDLGWLKNAFITDDLASALRAQGFTDGYLQSYDGFGCNLSARGEHFSLQVFDTQPDGIALVSEMDYARPLAFVSLHSHSINPGDADWYYEFESGEVRSIYLKPADGMPGTAIDDLLVWSDTLSCGALALSACPVYLADSFAPDALADADFFYAYCTDQVLHCSDPDVVFPALLDGYTLARDA